MTLLFLACLIALLLGLVLLRLLPSHVSSPDIEHTAFSEAHPGFIAEAVFSPRDWLFIQQQSSPALNSLFIHERRALAIHWLRDCLAAIHSVRANHLRQSRHSRDLSVLAEARLLILFFYFSALCRCLLVAVRFVQPSVPRATALYIQKLAGRVLPSPQSPTALSHFPIREVSRERLG